jgi:phosphoribosylformylglycinamidine synthase
MIPLKALIPTGYGLNCDYETDYALKKAGAESCRVHINELIKGESSASGLEQYHILVVGGGFSWGDDHGAGVLLASKMKFNLGEKVGRFLEQGKLVIGICNGFQSLVNWGLLPGFDGNYQERRVAITHNDTGNFIDTWVRLKINPNAPCVFTRGISAIELPVRHGEGKFFAADQDMDRLLKDNQVVVQYADEAGNPAQGKWPMNPNGSLMDIAGICDPTGRVFGLMPHPEAFNHWTNHPDWTRRKESLLREGKGPESEEGAGIQIFRNAVDYIREALNNGQIK